MMTNRSVMGCVMCCMVLLPAVCCGEISFTSMLGEISRIQRHNNISSVVLIITDPEEIILVSYMGQVSHHTEVDVDATSYLRIGSISKMFTGLALMRLVEQGRLSLNSNVASLVARSLYTNPWAATHPVQVAHLMEHTAGFTDMSGVEFKYKEPLSLEDAFLVDPASRVLRWPAGRHFSYSNSGSGIAAQVIENVTDRQFEAFVDEEVFAPLGLVSATYFPTNEVRSALITGYDSDGVTTIPYWHTLYRAFGGINIKPVEMARVIQMLMNEGVLAGKRLYSKQTIERMETPRTTLAAKTGLNYGYGLGLYHFAHRGFGFVGHGGDADGYLSYLAYCRNLGLGYFVSINAFNNSALNAIKKTINDSLIDSLIDKTPSPSWPVVAKLSPERRSQIVGQYDEVTFRFGRSPGSIPLEIVDEDGQLYTIYNSRRRLLIPVSEQHFRRLNEPYATIAILAADNKLYLQGDIGNFRKNTD